MRSSSCPNGFNTEETIKEIWRTDQRRVLNKTERNNFQDKLDRAGTKLERFYRENLIIFRSIITHP